MLNSGQLYQTKNCRICFRSLEPRQESNVCWMCATTIGYLDTLLSTEEGLFHVLQALDKRISGGPQVVIKSMAELLNEALELVAARVYANPR